MALEIVRAQDENFPSQGTFQDTYLRRNGELAGFFYRDQEIEYAGSNPSIMETIFFLRRGEIWGDERQWGRVTHHVPEVSKKDAFQDVWDLSLDLPVRAEKLAGADRRAGSIYIYTIFGSYEDERGKAAIKALSRERGKVDKIAYMFV